MHEHGEPGRGPSGPQTPEPLPLPRPPATPFGPAPVRRPGSIRRTSSWDSTWPDGYGATTAMRGEARDLITPAAGGGPSIAAHDWVEIRASPRREILSIRTCRENDAAQALVGAQPRGPFRADVARLFAEERAQLTPLYLLLDDYVGASFVAPWAWVQWRPADWGADMRRAQDAEFARTGRRHSMEGVCTGFRPGSTALGPDGNSRQGIQSKARVPPLARPDDPVGWHAVAPDEGVHMRRARRLDVWFEAGAIAFDVWFQDSATTPDGGPRIAVHEYHLSGAADPESFHILSLDVDPRLLPFSECMGAPPNVPVLIGEDLREFRTLVGRRLAGVLGCTHLNECLRTLADAPALADRLKQALAAPAA